MCELLHTSLEQLLKLSFHKFWKLDFQKLLEVALAVASCEEARELRCLVIGEVRASGIANRMTEPRIAAMLEKLREYAGLLRRGRHSSLGARYTGETRGPPSHEPADPFAPLVGERPSAARGSRCRNFLIFHQHS
jgi:hypothetical protein